MEPDEIVNQALHAAAVESMRLLWRHKTVDITLAEEIEELNKQIEKKTAQLEDCLAASKLRLTVTERLIEVSGVNLSVYENVHSSRFTEKYRLPRYNMLKTDPPDLKASLWITSYFTTPHKDES